MNNMTPAQRKRQSEAMKATWARKKAAKAPTASTTAPVAISTEDSIVNLTLRVKVELIG